MFMYLLTKAAGMVKFTYYETDSLGFCDFHGFFLGKAYPYWIWTPKTNKWVNPKHMVKPSPKEQFEFAMGFYNDKKYEDAKRRVQKVD